MPLLTADGGQKCSHLACGLAHAALGYRGLYSIAAVVGSLQGVCALRYLLRVAQYACLLQRCAFMDSAKETTDGAAPWPQLKQPCIHYVFNCELTAEHVCAAGLCASGKPMYRPSYKTLWRFARRAALSCWEAARMGSALICSQLCLLAFLFAMTVLCSGKAKASSTTLQRHMWQRCMLMHRKVCQNSSPLLSAAQLWCA